MNTIIDDSLMRVSKTESGYIARFKDRKGKTMRIPNGQDAYTVIPKGMSGVDDSSIRDVLLSRLRSGIRFGGRSSGRRGVWILSTDRKGHLRIESEDTLQPGLFESNPIDMSDSDIRNFLRGKRIICNGTEKRIAGFIWKKGTWEAAAEDSSTYTAKELLDNWRLLPDCIRIDRESMDALLRGGA